MKYKFLIVATLISFATYAQKKPVKKRQPLPPPPVTSSAYERDESDPENPFPESISFSWKNSPDTITTLRPQDIFEKTYTFNGRGRYVRVSTAYPKNGFEYKKPNKGEIEMAQSLTIRYKDYKNVTIAGNNIKIVSDDGQEVIKLHFTKKGNQVILLKELSTNKTYSTTNSYAGEPTIGF